MKMIKKIIGAVGILSVLLATPAQAVFIDTPGHQWQKSIEYLQSQSIIDGYADGTFGPDLKINRAEFTKILIESAYTGIDESYNMACFSDLSGEEWWAKYACFAKDSGILDGYEDGSFGGERLITQPEALKIIFNTLEEPVGTLGDNWYDRYFDYSEYLGMYYFDVKNRVNHEITRGETSYFITWLINEEWLDQINEEKFYQQKYRNGITYHTSDANECFNGETYDQEEMSCYLDCYSEQECLLREDEALKDLAESIEEYDAYDSAFDGDENTVTSYSIEGDQILFLSDSEDITDEDLLAIQQNRDAHREVWDYFKKIIPSTYRADLVRVEIFSDGNGETLAAVEQADADADPTKWVLYIDLADSHPDGVFDKKEFPLTIIHEFAHLLTLSDQELNLGESEENCQTYYPGEGCSYEKSYINTFYQSYWQDLNDEWAGAELDDFYAKYEDYFVTDYAATSPAEDIAESFMIFVIDDKPRESSIASQKVNFFYDYDELVDLREFIRARI